MEDLDPPPIRFYNTDNELITDYLLKKIKNEYLPENINIHDVDVFTHHLESIINDYPQAEEGKWYFFSSVKNTDLRSERRREFGRWNVRGNTKKILDDNGDTIDERRTLDFYEENGSKTEWSMHKYQVTNTLFADQPEMKIDEYVLCKIYKRKKYKKRDQILAASIDEINDTPIQDAVQNPAVLPPSTPPFPAEPSIPPIPAEPSIPQFPAEPSIPPFPAGIDQFYLGKVQLQNNFPVQIPVVFNLGNQQFRNDIPVQNPVVGPSVIPPPPAAQMNQFYSGGNYLDIASGSYGATLPYDHEPLPYDNDDLVLTDEFPDFDFFDNHDDV